MPVYPTGFSGEAIVPCSHCNANDKGPEAGICHRHSFFNNSINDPSCVPCYNAHMGIRPGLTAVFFTTVDSMTGRIMQIPCRQCKGRGYIKI